MAVHMWYCSCHQTLDMPTKVVKETGMVKNGICFECQHCGFVSSVGNTEEQAAHHWNLCHEALSTNLSQADIINREWVEDFVRKHKIGDEVSGFRFLVDKYAENVWKRFGVVAIPCDGRRICRMFFKELRKEWGGIAPKKEGVWLVAKLPELDEHGKIPASVYEKE